MNTIGKIVDKLFIFLVSIAINGVMAFILSAFFYILVAGAFILSMVPVAVIAGRETANAIINFVFKDETIFVIIYTLTFISMVADDLGIPNIKTAYLKWRENKN